MDKRIRMPSRNPLGIFFLTTPAIRDLNIALILFFADDFDIRGLLEVREIKI